jgi:hypothetical protein
VEVQGVNLNLTKVYNIDDFGIAIITFSKQTIAVLEKWLGTSSRKSLNISGNTCIWK